jgi:hypothetical protein
LAKCAGRVRLLHFRAKCVFTCVGHGLVRTIR